MPSFLERAAATDKELRGTQERDPADLSGAQEPDWDDPSTWGGNGSSASDSASRNASDSPDSSDAKPRTRSSSSPGPRGRPPRRRGRPRGPERRPLSVRILAPTDRKLTVAVEQTGLNPQTLVEQALEAHFKRLKITDPGPESENPGS